MSHALARARTLRVRDRYILLGAVALLYVTCIPFSNGDMRAHLVPWTRYLLDHGRFAALADNFSEYSPPYLYLLSLASRAEATIGVVAVIKLVAIAGTLLLAGAITTMLGSCQRRAGDTRCVATCGGVVMLCLPTVIANGPVWGQCDALYTAFTLLAIAAFVRGHAALAMAAVGMALAFKLQAIFIAPLVLAMLLAGRARWWMLTIPPAVYATAMLPAWIAGRPARDLALLYIAQGQYFHDLARSVPNVWQILRALVTIPYELGVAIGLAAAAAATVTLAWRARRHLDDPANLLLTALAGAILVPYLLPKMHNRYFFMADVLALAYAFIRPSARTFRIVVLTQIGSLLAYATFLLHLTGGAFVGAFFMSGALVLVLREVRGRMPRIPRARAHLAGSCPQFISE
ncbi:hypothetical protein ASE95_14300 [Sphingomonas sp. Leaf231]|uniref:hypothetical protein n=1 Tax=Sphingomonas sp. Leaf231 TaxID=1736301 RepID=UPI0006FF9E62|nr:hypothetical protein [Sphingomonas sp. Leaf231]KQN90622.1 hypothetical protein ASE95_14300 [Sphingomonas sp. Leaf231]